MVCLSVKAYIPGTSPLYFGAALGLLSGRAVSGKGQTIGPCANLGGASTGAAQGAAEHVMVKFTSTNPSLRLHSAGQEISFHWQGRALLGREFIHVHACCQTVVLCGAAVDYTGHSLPLRQVHAHLAASPGASVLQCAWCAVAGAGCCSAMQGADPWLLVEGQFAQNVQADVQRPLRPGGQADGSVYGTRYGRRRCLGGTACSVHGTLLLSVGCLQCRLASHWLPLMQSAHI
jgi:hypothetical protein